MSGLARIYDVRMAQFVLKVKNCRLSWVRADPKTYGLRPRLWLLGELELRVSLFFYTVLQINTSKMSTDMVKRLNTIVDK